MAGHKQGNFPQLISPFLEGKLAEALARQGMDSAAYQALARQYVRSELEAHIHPLDRRRHYEAEVTGAVQGQQLKGVERLYRRTVLLEPTTACAAHCRWCLRGQYDSFTLREADVDRALEYFAADPEIREVLITGGDPLMSPRLLAYVLRGLGERVPNIEIVRIGTRVPLQAPERVAGELLAVLQAPRPFRLEMGLHICHPTELWPEVRRVLATLSAANIRLYNQHPLLKAVNDDRDTLIALYDEMRRLGIEAHYLFHAIPMRGMAHHRTSIARGLELVAALASGGQFSGRAKPHFCAMTDIGKVVLYHGSILQRDEATACVLLRSQYRLEDRLRYNPSWQMPSSVVIDKNGFMNVWYPDGADDQQPLQQQSTALPMPSEVPC